MEQYIEQIFERVLDKKLEPIVKKLTQLEQNKNTQNSIEKILADLGSKERLSIKEVANKLKKSVKTIHNWGESGKLEIVGENNKKKYVTARSFAACIAGGV